MPVDKLKEIATQKRWVEANRDKVRQAGRAWYYRNKEKQAEYARNYYRLHPEKSRERGKRFRENNREWVNEYAREYFRRNKDKILARQRKTTKTKEYREKINRFVRNKLETDVNFKLSSRLRNRIKDAIKRGSADQGDSTERLLGCSIDFVRNYLECRFEPGMAWENYGYRGWHIDHIIPCAEFDLTDPEQQRMCFHYTNIRPMWGLDNIKKGFKVPDAHQFEMI